MGKRCPYCRQIIADESLFCPECGKEFPIGRTCSFCGGAISDDDVFCPNCGVVVAKGKACPHCRAAINEGDLFCSNCGAKIDKDEENSHSDHEEVKAEERTDSPKVVEVQPIKPIAPSPPPTESEYEEGTSDDLQELEDTSQKKYGKWIVISFILIALIGGGAYFLLNRSSNKWESKGEIVTNGSRTLYGTIGELPITMELHIEASKVDGSMYYNKYGPSNKLFVSGSMHHNEIELTEHNKDGMETGRYNGKYSNGLFQGSYTNYKGDVYSFSLSEARDSEEALKLEDEKKDYEKQLNNLITYKNILTLRRTCKLEDAHACGLKKVYERNDEWEDGPGDHEIIYGRDVEIGNDDSVIATSSHAIYFRYSGSGSSYAEIFFKDKNESELFWNDAIENGLTFEGNCYVVPSTQYSGEHEAIFSPPEYKDGWYYIYLGEYW